MNSSVNIGIIHYGCGNAHNVKRSLEKIGVNKVVIVESGSLKSYDILILPGVGSYKNAMSHLTANNHFREILEHVKKGKKLLGICLGMQLLMRKSEEFGETNGLNILSGNVISMKGFIKDEPLPHVGINQVVVNSVLIGYFYFDHSYKVVLKRNEKKLHVGVTSYGGHEFVSYIKEGNVTAVQFHPEISGKAGLDFLINFVKSEVV